MQRRAAAVYVAVFLVVGLGAYGVAATAQAPNVALQADEVDEEGAVGTSFTVDGVEYTVANVSETTTGGGGGHGGGGGSTTMQGELTYEATVTDTETLESGDVIERDGMNWSVEVPNESDPAEFTLVENFTIDRPTVEQNGSTYVVVEENGTRTLVPREEYLSDTFGEPETRTFQEGDAWNDNRTVGNVTAESVPLEMQVVEPQTVTVTEGSNATLGESGTPYTAHFPDDSTIQLTTNYEAYHEETAAVERFHDRVDGLWGVAILSTLASLLLVGLAYLPTKGD
jgi:hypothetical protein